MGHPPDNKHVHRAGHMPTLDLVASKGRDSITANGGNDVIIYTVNSYILQQNLPRAQLIASTRSFGSIAPRRLTIRKLPLP